MKLNLQKGTIHEGKEITEIYRGRDHACRCGCCGKYYTPEDKNFKRLVNEINKNDAYYLTDNRIGETYINIPYDKERDMCFCVYFD